MRYDDDNHFKLWKEQGRFPAIHDALWNLLQTEATGTGFCDLCCSIGLLGQRILEQFPGVKSVVGVEGLEVSVERARAAGVRIPIKLMMVTPQTLPDLCAYLKEHKVDTLVARRCLSEIFANDQSWGDRFVEELRAAGVREFFIQGRQVTPNATHPIPDVQAEIRVLGKGLRTVQCVGECAYLVPR